MYKILRIEVGKTTTEKVLYRGHDRARMETLLAQERAVTPSLVKGTLVAVHLYDEVGAVCEDYDNQVDPDLVYQQHQKFQSEGREF